MPTTYSPKEKSFIKKWLKAKRDGLKVGFDIEPVLEGNFNEFYILLRPTTGLYRDQWQIINMKLSYGSGVKYIYPIDPPLVKFITKVFHVNISQQGSICVDILKQKDKWMPTYDFTQIIMNIILLYQQPNTKSPFNGSASSLYLKCRELFKEKKVGKRNMTVIQEEELEEQCFAEYKKAADVHANDNMNKWTKWFPQINGAKHEESSIIKLEKQFADVLVKKKKAEKKKKVNKWAVRRAKKNKSKEKINKDKNTEEKENNTKEDKDKNTE